MVGYNKFMNLKVLINTNAAPSSAFPPPLRPLLLLAIILKPPFGSGCLLTKSRTLFNFRTDERICLAERGILGTMNRVYECLQDGDSQRWTSKRGPTTLIIAPIKVVCREEWVVVINTRSFSGNWLNTLITVLAKVKMGWAAPDRGRD